MQETLELIIRYIRDIWRFRWYAIGMTCLIIPIGWLVVSWMPVTYNASAKVYVDTHTVLQPLLKGITLETDPNAYIGLMARELVSRPNVEQVARLVGLDSQAGSPQEWENLLARLERSVNLESSRTRKGAPSDLYTISYTGKTPELAKQVVESFITTFEERTVGESRRDSETAKRFLEMQINAQQQRMMALENQIREFKNRHIDSLPDQGVGYFQRLHSAQAEVDNIDLEIASAEYKKKDLQRQLNSTPATQKAVSSDGKPVLSSIESRALAIQTRLDELLLKYTDEHPDVMATRRSLAELNRQVESEVSENVMPNPVYQQLQATLGQVESEIAAAKAKRNEFVSRVQKLRKQTGPLTRVEAQLQAMTREYELEKTKLETLTSRQDAANMMGNVELTGEDVRFRVIDPPRVKNASKDRARKKLLLAAGVPAAGVAGGIGLAFLLSLIWPVVYGRRSLADLADLPVFGSVSQVATKKLNIRKRFDLAALTMVMLIFLTAHATVVLMEIKQIDITEIPAFLKKGAGNE